MTGETIDITPILNALQYGAQVRIEIGSSINLTKGGGIETAYIWARNADGRWKRLKPMLVPPEGGGRAELLDTLASMVRYRPTEDKDG